MYQLPREFGSFNGLAVLCISVDCARLGVLWRSLFTTHHNCKTSQIPFCIHPPGSLPFEALHIFLNHGMLKIYLIQALIMRQFVSISEIKTTVTPIASMPAVKLPLNILLTIKTIST